MSSNDNSANGSKENGNSLMDSTNMDKVLRDAKGLASELHIRFTNWWNAMTPISTSSTSATTPKLPKTELDIKQALRKSMSFATPTQSSKSGSNSSNIGIRLWFLGTPYFIMEKDLEELNPEAFQPFLEDFSSRLWFTYRHHFPPLRPATFTTDSGWGCMLRTGQCLLGQTFVLKHLGRDWRLKDTEDPKIAEEYMRIVGWFLDDYSSSSPFSLHRIALLGQQFEKEIGEWFGPHTIAQVLRALVKDLNWIDLDVYVNGDGMVYKNSILPKDPNEKMKPTLILLPIRLGVDVLNPVYYLALKSIFGFPQTVGIAGGKPSSSLYFVGFEDDNIFYLDPHQAHPSITRSDPFTPESFSSYHCQIPKKAPISSLDPCMLIGFYIKDEADFDDFCKRSEEIINKAKPIYRLADEAPVYTEDIDCDGLSEDEDAII